jgi:heat shock factor-binding protein 1
MAEGEATEPKTMDELTALANDLMAGMESTFESASAGITDRLDEVGAKLDEIETNVGDLMTQLGVDADEPAAAESES